MKYLIVTFLISVSFLNLWAIPKSKYSKILFDTTLNIGCVTNDDYTIKGMMANSFIYRLNDLEEIYYSDGAVSLYRDKLRLNTGRWSCGQFGIEVM